MFKGKNYHIVIGILLLGAVFYFFSSAREAKIANYPSSGTDIIAFGDSLVVGAGATYGNDFVSLLSKKIGQEIINLGVSGDSRDDGLARLDELDRYRPRVVLVLLGGNDHLKKVPMEKTFENLGKIIQNIQSRGAIVILLGVKGNLLGDKFEPKIKKIHKRCATAFIPGVLDGLFVDFFELWFK